MTLPAQVGVGVVVRVFKETKHTNQRKCVIFKNQEVSSERSHSRGAWLPELFVKVITRGRKVTRFVARAAQP
jgi:hypothetical protein